MKEHEIIEKVYRYASIAFECKWQHLRRIPQVRNIILLALSQFIERGALSELFDMTRKRMTDEIIYRANRAIKSDLSLKTKYHFILNNCYN